MSRIQKRLSWWHLLSWNYWIGQEKSLALKLTIAITSVAITAIGSITLLSIQREQKNFRTELQQQAILLSDALDITLRDPLYRSDVHLLRQFVNTLNQNEEALSSASIYDEQGRLLADADRPTPIYETDIDPVGARLINYSTPIFEWYDDELVVSRAILIGEQPVGAIRLGLATATLQQKVADVRNRGIFAALVAAIISALVAQWISRSITKPLQELIKGTEAIAQGNFNHPLQIHTGDEFAVLAQAFTKMSQQLQHTLSMLEQQNEDLEVRVQQRTQKLTQTLKELTETQDQLIHSEKMSSLGQMIAGIAHEINNPVSFIYGNLPYVEDYTQKIIEIIQLYEKQDLALDPEIEDQRQVVDLPFLQEDLGKILQSMRLGTERIQEIVVSLRNFSRLDEADLKLADIHAGIDSTLMILQHRLKANSKRPAIQLQKNYGDLPLITCHPGQLNQVFMNLLVNAIDALEDYTGKRSYEELKAHPNIIQIHTSVSSNQQVTIAIQDNGPGILKILKSKLFNPFFTTKPIGKGTGLGLSICYDIITEKHGGKISCKSERGKGTTFLIELPIRKQLDSQPV